jgi:plastocyanin
MRAIALAVSGVFGALVILAVLGMALAFVAGCDQGSLDTTDVVATNEVAVKDNKFDARVIEVPAGTQVTWAWQGERTHNVQGDGWSSDNQDEGTFQHSFASPGAYDYRCTLHAGMTGRVIVTR